MTVLKKRSEAEIRALIVNRPDIMEFVPDDELELVCAALGVDMTSEFAKVREQCEQAAAERRNR